MSRKGRLQWGQLIAKPICQMFCLLLIHEFVLLDEDYLFWLDRNNLISIFLIFQINMHVGGSEEVSQVDSNTTSNETNNFLLKYCLQLVSILFNVTH